MGDADSVADDASDAELDTETDMDIVAPTLAVILEDVFPVAVDAIDGIRVSDAVEDGEIDGEREEEPESDEEPLTEADAFGLDEIEFVTETDLERVKVVEVVAVELAENECVLVADVDREMELVTVTESVAE